jgi:hypothetical protein
MVVLSNLFPGRLLSGTEKLATGKQVPGSVTLWESLSELLNRAPYEVCYLASGTGFSHPDRGKGSTKVSF